jgi:hypothetical protein
VPKNVWAVQIKVFDNEGNVAEKTVYDWGEFLSLLLFPTIFLLVIIAALFFTKRIYGHRQRSN